MSQQPDIATVVIASLIDKIVAEVRAHEKTRAEAAVMRRDLAANCDANFERARELENNISDLDEDLAIARRIMTPKQLERFEKAAAEAKEIPF